MKWLLILFIICIMCDESGSNSGPDTSKKHLTLTMINGLYSPPANVNVTFFVLDNQKQPVSTLLYETVQLAEDGQFIFPNETEAALYKVFVPYTLYGLILLDLSGSVKKYIGDIRLLENAVLNFLANVDSSYRLAIYAFDGQSDIHEISPGLGFSDDIGRLQEAANKIIEFQFTDSSTNLYGAIIKGIETLDALKCGKLSQCNLLVFTDGTDRAEYYALSELQDVLDQFHAGLNRDIITIGFSGEINPSIIKLIGQDGSLYPIDVSDLSYAFTQAASHFNTIRDYILLLQNSVYKVSYCSPARNGLQTLSISFTGFNGSLDFDFEASLFTGQCAASDIICKDKLDCLTSFDYCVSGVCGDICQSVECGSVFDPDTNFWIDCGNNCPASHDICENNLCLNVCEIYECGLFNGVDCGGCPSDETCVDGVCQLI